MKEVQIRRGAEAGPLTQGQGHQLAAHPVKRRGGGAEGQVLGQDAVVDGREGLLAREAHSKHAEVALPRTTTSPRQVALGQELVARASFLGSRL